MSGHREDVNDATRLASLNQVRHDALHQEERPADVGIEVFVPDFQGRIEQSASAGCSCGVDEPGADTKPL